MEITADHFNVWMDEYINHPEKFDLDWQTVLEHVTEKALGHENTYGENCMAYLKKLDRELNPENY